MIDKQEIKSNQDLQLQIIRYYYPQVDPEGKFFKIREEKSPSARLRLFKGLWYLKDFGDSKKAQDCFSIVMDREACDFSTALKIITQKFRYNEEIPNQSKVKDDRYDELKKLVSAIICNPKTKAEQYLASRGINVTALPVDSFYYDSIYNAVAFFDSARNVINRRLITPKEGAGKARMTKYKGFDAVYDVLYKAIRDRVYLTEGVIDSLSLQGYSTLAIFTTGNQIKQTEKLKAYFEDKEIVIAFDNDDAGDACYTYYVDLIFNSGIEISGLRRLLLPKGKDVNDLLNEGVLESFLADDENYEIVQKSDLQPGSDLQKKAENNDSKSFNPTRNQQIEAFLSGRYDVRYNSIKQQPEYRKANNGSTFLPIDKYVLNSIRRELNQNSLNTSVQNIKSILESDYAPVIHPIQLYFNELPKWEGVTDYIQKLAETITVENPEVWYAYLKKWLVAVVSNVMNNSGCQNHTCMVITGKQGAFKTTWLDNLCPDALKQYLFTGKIDPSNKDSLTYIAEYFLINIDDQLRQLNKKDENDLKNLITTPSVKYRRPYDVYITEYPHTASFMASVNGNDFLTDPTGSRRFLPFEAKEINIKQALAIDMNLVYSQALHLYKEGFHYWFDRDEIESQHTHNQAFQVVSTEEQLVLEYFDKPDKRENATDYLQSAMIQSYLENQTKSRLSPKKLGEALTKLGFEKWQRTHSGKTKWVWSVISKPLPQVEDENTNNKNPF